MKKLVIILFCIGGISISAIAQQSVRVFRFEIIANDRKDQSQDNPQDDSNSAFASYHQRSGFWGFGFVLPDNGSGYYNTIGGSSINFDIGRMQRYHFARRFAIGTTFNYSYYNFKLRDAAAEPLFNYEVRKDKPFMPNDVRKEVFRSHNVAAGLFARSYLIPPKSRGKDGLYIDLGAQGDFAFSKYYIMRHKNGGKDKHRNGYAFNPFTASAVARIGLGRGVSITCRRNDKCWGVSSRALFIRYRLTEAFNKPKALPMDLPPITVGIQFF